MFSSTYSLQGIFAWILADILNFELVKRVSPKGLYISSGEQNQTSLHAAPAAASFWVRMEPIPSQLILFFESTIFFNPYF